MDKKSIEGRNINLRDIENEDASFVLSLRTDSQKSKYLNPTDNDLERQKEYIAGYKSRKDECYFIIESKTGEKLGTVRIYDVKEDSFSWGSWIVKENAPLTTAIESAILIYEYAFYRAGFKRVHFEVRKGNEKVVGFHKRFGAWITGEDNLNYYFNYDVQTYEKNKGKYSKFLNKGKTKN